MSDKRDTSNTHNKDNKSDTSDTSDTSNSHNKDNKSDMSANTNTNAKVNTDKLENKPADKPTGKLKLTNKPTDKRKLLIICVLLLLVVLALVVIFKFLRPNIFEGNLKVEIYDDVTLYDLIKKDELKNVKTKDVKIDTTKLGQQTFEIEYKDRVISMNVNVVDTTKPVIEAPENIKVATGCKTKRLLSYATVSDNSEGDGKSSNSGNSDNAGTSEGGSKSATSKSEIKLSIKGKYNLKKAGKYKLKFVAEDSSGNTAEQSFVLTVLSLESAPSSYAEYKNLKDGDYATSNGYILTIKDGVSYVDGRVIVNKTYAVPSTYSPVDPSSVDSERCVDKTTIKAFNEMKEDAKALGLNLYIISGYRSYSYQQTLFNRYSRADGVASAERYSARPGHSEHQTGYCFDLNSVSDSFANTAEGQWIAKNAYLYGFILRYPKEKESVTGYVYESWHLRYVGTELAKELYNDGDWITLEEYYGLSSKYE